MEDPVTLPSSGQVPCHAFLLSRAFSPAPSSSSPQICGRGTADSGGIARIAPEEEEEEEEGLLTNHE